MDVNPESLEIALLGVHKPEQATIQPTSYQLSPLVISIIEISQICVVTTTVPFYLFLLFFMVQAQIRQINELATPFFKLCISTAIIDLSTLFANYFGVMFPKFGLFHELYVFLDGIYAHTYFYIAWSTGICQAMSVSVLATNRLSAMLFPGEYRNMWSSYRLWIAISIQFVPGMIMGFLTFFNKTELSIIDEKIVPKFVNKQFTSIFFGVGGFFLFSNCLYLIIAYCYLFISLKKNNKKMSPQLTVSRSKMKFRRRERRLFIMCSIVVAVQLLILMFFIVKTLGWFQFNLDEFYVLYNALSDLFASINPYLLWIFSDSLRKYVLFKMGFRRTSSPNTTVATVAFDRSAHAKE